jgi:uncharacterized protein YgiM (DUF1202 family)
MQSVIEEKIMRPLSVLLVFVSPAWCFADSAIPIETVEDYVNIRLMPDSATEIVGHLNQGESVQIVSTQEGWYEVVLEGDATGYISADWTLVVDAAALAAMRERIAEEKAREEAREEAEEKAREEAEKEVVEEVIEAGEPEVRPDAGEAVEPEVQPDSEAEIVPENERESTIS